jgi:hypothetical protein
MMPNRRTPTFAGPRPALVEPLESRRLMAGEPWNANARLIDQDDALSRFPSLTGAGQTIAVIDTGIDYTHPLLGGGFGPGKKVVGGYDFVDDDDDPRDTYGHGTHVAGLLAGSPFVRDGVRYAGVAPQAKLVALRIDEANDPVPDERIESALRWVIDNRTRFGITVVNISFGYGNFAADEVNSVFGDELKKLKDLNVFVVASSGNNGVADPPGIQYPAADPNVFAVGSVDRFDTISEFTERGPTLDLLAPGQGVHALDLNDGIVGTDFTTVGGTSFATPLVSATAALLRQADPGLTAPDIRSILRASSVNARDGDDEFGFTTDLTYGRLDLDAALKLATTRKPGPLGQAGGEAHGANNNALAYDADGVLHFVYYDSVDRTLKYAIRSAAAGTAGRWSDTFTIDTSADHMGQYVSLAVDDFGRPAVAYFDGSAGDLRYARFDGDAWHTTVVDSRGSVGLYPSLVFDRNDLPAISYFQKTDGDLRLARHNGTRWNIYTIDSEGVVGRSTSMVVDRTGRLSIAYEDTKKGHLLYGKESSPGGAWSRTTVDGSTLGVAWMSLAVDRDNRPAIAYYDAWPADLKYARLDDGAWQTETLGTKGAQGLYSTLAITPDGKHNILFYNRQLNQTLHARGTFGNWTISSLHASGGRHLAATTSPRGDLTYTWFETGPRILRVVEA